ncbi:MAG TPA: DUF1571 domain-containing protein [Bacteroidia bacterium]|jgi:hypothetical protein|nr:DUF1571 domain-containing protein [Bacteroidia bacterium]
MKTFSWWENITVLFFIAFCSVCKVEAQSCEDIFKKMFENIKNVKTLRTNISTTERIDDHINRAHFAVKLNISPYKAYSKDIDKGVELLYLEGKNDNEATVNPNGFPYVNLNLDPLGKTMRKDQHQTITRLGFNYISEVLFHSLSKYPDVYTKYVKRDADTVWDSYPCYKIEINFTNYTFTQYTVTGTDETITKLAARYFLSEYKLLTLNKISWYDDVLKNGKQLLMPSAYAKSTILIIRKDNYLPVVMRIYDDKGFFEAYTYTKLQLNSSILDTEFTENYPGYHF